jgi:hypothetical protein
LFFAAGFVLSRAQIAKRAPVSKGPRALALLELAANGKAHLVPVTIMINGKFYDAASYKADPVPMALQRETVYEVLKTGVSQGLFSVTNATQTDPNQPQGRRWVANGNYRTAAQIEAEKARTKSESDRKAQKGPAPETEIGGPPKLHRGSSSKTSSPATAPPVPEPAPVAAPKIDPAPKPAETRVADDPNRPVLRRQAPSDMTHEQTKSGGESEPLKGPLQFIPAISDEGGPSPRPYSYQMKPEEEAGYLKKMLAIAAEEVKARAAGKSEDAETKPKSRTPKTATKAARTPQFQDVQLRVFDLSNTNEPVLVLTANARLAATNDLEYMIAVVARQDIYAELHKVFAQTTDGQHLDILPKYDLIDAVDADGDGHGELLFRMTSEAGSAFGIYRVIGDRLWPVFEGKPGS